MKILRRFHYKGKTYHYEQEWNKKVEDCGKVVVFRGEVWEWQMYDNPPNPPPDWILDYTRVPTSQYDGHCVEEIVGPLDPKKSKCDCGVAVTHGENYPADKHPKYCRTRTEDPWEGVGCEEV